MTAFTNAGTVPLSGPSEIPVYATGSSGIQVHRRLLGLASNFLWARNPEINRGFQEVLQLQILRLCVLCSRVFRLNRYEVRFFRMGMANGGRGSFDSALESWSPRMSGKVRDAGSGLGHVDSAPRTANISMHGVRTILRVYLESGLIRLTRSRMRRTFFGDMERRAATRDTLRPSLSQTLGIISVANSSVIS